MSELRGHGGDGTGDDGDGDGGGDPPEKVRGQDDPAQAARGRADNVADIMRGRSAIGGYDDPVWDLPPDQIEAELSRRATAAKADRIAPRERLDPPAAGAGRADTGDPLQPQETRPGDQVVAANEADRTRAEKVRSELWSSGNDILDKTASTINRIDNILRPPAGHPATETGRPAEWTPSSTHAAHAGDVVSSAVFTIGITADLVWTGIRHMHERKENGDGRDR